MGVIGGTLGYWILKRINSDGETGYMSGDAYTNKSKLEVLLGADFWPEIRDKLVIDFGCGEGAEVIEMVKRGAGFVIGLDIQEEWLKRARQRAAREGVEARCTFATHTTQRADVITALDSFEHFADPGAILRTMRELLKPGGYVLAAFGPTWYHPLGGHLFSVFPWSHVIFTEKSLLRWRADFKSDGATRFEEVAGGLNQMTISRFERIVAESPFRLGHFEAVPIRKLRRVANRLTREFTTAIVRCKLIPRE